MASSFTIQGHRQFLSNSRAEFAGDTKRIWTISNLTIKGSRKFLSTNYFEYVGDLRRIWTPGGLVFQGSRNFQVSNRSFFTGDIRRIWTPGGLLFQGARKFLISNKDEYSGDTFRIVHITIVPFQIHAYFTRRILQPPGIPWLQEEVTSAAWCWKLTLKDGTVLGFTNHDEDIVLAGTLYEAAAGFVPTAVETSNNMAVDNLEVEGCLGSDRISEKDIAGGRFDFAKVEIFLCNWVKTKDPVFMIRKGTIGQVKHGRYGFQAEVRGLLEAYQQSAGTVYQKSCRARLGDSRCKVNLDGLATAGQVTQLNADGTLGINLINAAGYFDYGVLTFTTGDNTGGQYEVKTFVDGVITLFLPTAHSIAVGDTFTVLPGCDGNFSTCRTKFGNGLNFRGEPHVPGNDFQSAYPGQGSSNTVSAGSNVRRG